MINANLLQLVVEASNDGIVVAEQEGEDHILIYANPAFEALTGYSSEEILYQDCRFLQGEERSQLAAALLRKAIHSRQPCREVIRNYRKDGTTFWNELSITPVFNETDQLTYFIGIQKNVSEHVANQERVKALESEVQTLRAELAELKKRG
ncbi:PAS domain-containing protein [Phytopseudomonas punonensis]|uniref:PAS domain S-box-containing protein n=1 Tax=Phytopseudomonas punonensis TaxID=1220495 RepID=A0A1M7FK09_9GAMM|nr:PAS domain-containing protein [Pseudomonas punonensis]SHM04108.1 PAS domain S-box-containing protein [Pseudomonas punonensis]